MNGDDWIYHEPDNWTRLLDDQENAQGWAHQLEQEASMAFKHEEGRGSGYKNDSANPKAPNLKGTMVWKGETIHWALWRNTKRKDTDPDVAIKLEEPREKEFASRPEGRQNEPQQKERNWGKAPDDDLPF